MKADQWEEFKKDRTTQKYFSPLTKGAAHILIKNILDEIKTIRPESILDVGCGTGYVTREMVKTVPDITAVDTDSKRIQLAKSAAGNQIDYRVIQPEKLPFSNDSFSLVTCIEVLEHIPDYNRFLQELKRVSKNSIIITVPFEPFFRAANFLRGKHLAHLGNIPGHINHFNKRSLSRILREHLQVKKIKTSAYFWIMAICKTPDAR